MSRRNKIGLVIGILALFVGGIGFLVWFLVHQQQPVTDYYTRKTAIEMLNYIQEADVAGLGYEADSPEMEKGITAGDGKGLLQQYLGYSDTDLKELLKQQWEAGDTIGFLYKLREQRVLSRQEFQNVYEYIVIRSETDQVKIENLLVLDLAADTTDHCLTLITPDGEYRYYAETAEQEEMQSELSKLEDRQIRVYAVADPEATQANARRQEVRRILEYTGKATEPVLVSNVWIESYEETQLRVFLNGYHKTYSCNLDVEDPAALESSLADIKLSDEKVTDIIRKTDVLSAKVLAVSDQGVELEGYGLLQLSDHYKIYKIYGELAVEPTSQILVGYTTTNFVVADGVIEAALITEPIHADKIRVVLGNSDYTSLIHDTVVLTADCPYTMDFNGQTKTFQPGEEVTLTLNCGYLAGGRVVLTPQEENGRIQVLTITRNGIQPQYRGTIEVAPYGELGLTIVNELSLEEYLYTVVPSEMPTSYGEEALQVQAICARGYAYSKMQDGTYAKYGAHLDDSTMTQVYNAVAESDESILAVKDTYGMVPFYDGKVIEAYFFSTSCGITCSNADVWDGDALPYLTDKIECEGSPEADFSEEAAFRSFIDDSSAYDTYEKEYSLYRWTIVYTPEQMTAAIDATLAQRYESNPAKVLTLQADGSYKSQPIDTVGQVQSVEVTGRGKSGIVKEITITGEKATVKVVGQTNARALMTPNQVVIERQDGAKSEGWSLLPSPFYYIVQDEAGNYVIHGGGFGHGVGMSQNGTKAMTERGYSAEDIIRHYYTGVDIVNIYQ